MELKAVEELMLISDRPVVATKVIKRALKGRLQVGETRASQVPNGRAPSRAKANSCLRDL